jgi:Flp pilus assembly pilin Flp
MLSLYVRTEAWLTARMLALVAWLRPRSLAMAMRREEGQTTAEYALVILAAAAIAVVLITWARSSGKLPAFFDKIIDDITNSAG